MIKKLAGILGVLVLSGLLINSMLMTFYLKKIDSGLNENLHSVRALGQLQKSIIDKNGELTGMIGTIGQIDGGLDAAIDRTSRLLVLLTQVVNLNADTLQINNAMEQSSLQSGATITSVNQSLKTVGPYTAQMKGYLESLKKTAASDAQKMNDIRQSAERMNQKLPGGP
ncbi:hypothetical protein [Aneurinibacillus tyrosinisolvens]|uniref:hypothetical protein n=1 Tax=Aneurinibacillus tyrosinisolvens TaxID=1443435 RepID=UPI00063F6E2C|nr:hypothetical protein [Aneurinibacillus tyrosinisolvens]